MQDYTKLLVWRAAHELTLDVHRVFARVGRGIPNGLKAQILRASASVPANIAEGCGRRTRAELARFVDVAIGSATELEYHLLLARDLGMIATRDHERLAARTRQVLRMLVGLSRRVRAG